MFQEWVGSFEAFIAYLGPRPSELHEIDRYPNNDGNYEPGNVRWATRKEQANNRRSNRMVTAFGITKTLMEWGESSGLGWATIKGRLELDWMPERAVSEPPHKSSLPKGVQPSGKRFRARMRVDRKSIDIGYFDTPEEASAAYIRATSDAAYRPGLPS